ncbi:MAG TPA: hypothetical protein VEA61_05885 [Allosphingosinicella sp.]|nr:hypothetical protein [Allosphingosinicella sp.]
MRLRALLLGGLSLAVLSGCSRIHLVQDPPAIPPAFAESPGLAFNAGRVQSIAVSPVNRKRVLVAMEFGGLWGTINGGESWFRVFALPAVMIGDVEFGADGTTVVATLFRDNQVANGGGIYVSRDRGGSWSRPATGVVPATPLIRRTSAYGISRAPDDDRLWYVGTDFGVAVSTDNGATWMHKALEASSPSMVQAVLAFPQGQVLALTPSALYRSDDRGGTWRKVLSDTFSQNFQYGVSKMDRSPHNPWAFIFREYHFNSDDPADRFGTLWFYELDTDRRTLLTTPQGRSRGPFVRVTTEAAPGVGPSPITVWLGHGWDGFRVTREKVGEFRALTKGDWTSYIATAGIHADMSDLGVDAARQPVFLGSDGGIFKPRPPLFTATGDWVSAAVPGSAMNSLQITDLAGTNIRRPDGALISTSLYFGTQDNNLWASPDGGRTWPRFDDTEGYDLEVRHDARPGEPITIGYVEFNSGELFADANFVNQRLVPNVDQNGQMLETLDPQGRPSNTMKQAFYLEPSAGGTETSWLRLRIGGAPGNGIYVSTNSGNNWRRRFNLNFSWAGSVQRTNVAGGPVIAAATASPAPDAVTSGFRQGLMAWMSVDLGSGGIGLVLLSNLYADRVDTIDDSDVVRLPGGGSLGKRAAQLDWHAVFGADPNDWRFLIAPDIVSGVVKVSRDGGQTWATDQRLTAQVLKGGQLKMYDLDGYHMQVTKIAFDPYRRGRILVGTRDAGVICTTDNGKTWRTITNSGRISYVTGFHFYPNGAAHIASWGHGLWYLDRTTGCSQTDPPYWRDRIPPVAGAEPPIGLLAGQAEQPPPPRGVAYPGVAKLFATTAYPASGVAVLGPDHQVQIRGRNFPAGREVTLDIRTAEPLSQSVLKQMVQTGRDGTFSTSVQLPRNLPYAAHTIEAIGGPEARILSVAHLVKTPAADEGDERDAPRYREGLAASAGLVPRQPQR